MKVAVIGTGHVGLVTCVSLAHLGHDVIGCDTDPDKLARLYRGEAPFYEPGLPELLGRGLSEGNLSFTPDAKEAVTGAEVIFISVGTPARANGEANLVAVEQATRAIAHRAPPGAVIVEKSTVPAGTADRIRQTLLHERSNGHGIEVASNPEFLREGQAIKDALEPDRILVGAESAHAFETMRRLYEPLTSKGCPLIETDVTSAELAKHACNAFLALKISYANALARMCERAGADVRAVTDVMGSDPRIGPHFLRAGLGWGGYCFPKDLIAFEKLASRLGYDFPLLREVAHINEEAVEAVVEKVSDALWNLEDKRIALLGLSFKPDTDDVRFSPALALAGKLLAGGATVVGYDPQAGAETIREVPELEIATSAYDAVEGVHCLVLTTEWDEFRSLDLAAVRDAMVYPIVIDGRNALDAERVAASGLTYYPTGTSPLPAAQPTRV
jgi:UDPglucose 6-dehydrogenase